MTSGDRMEPAKETIERLQQSLQRQESSTGSQFDSAQCPKCFGNGYVMSEKDGERRAVECMCVKEKRVQARLPRKFRIASLLDFPKSVQDFVLDWLAKPGDGLLITGGVGRGKTHLAAALVRTLLLIGQEAKFSKCARLYGEVREAYRLNTGEPAVLAEYLRHRFLFLDDLGAGGLSDHERRITLQIIDERLDEMLPTTITSNWGIEEIAEKMDARIASRLQTFTFLALDGPDRRLSLGVMQALEPNP
jgi:DNA replication protein DnaC